MIVSKVIKMIKHVYPSGEFRGKTYRMPTGIKSFLFLVLLSCLAVNVSGESELTLALLCGEGKYKPREEIASELGVLLSEQKGVALLEREKIRLILKEQSLKVGGMLKVSDQLRVGNLLGARVLLFFDRLRVSGDIIYSARAVEASTGLSLGTVMLPEKAAQKDLSPILKLVKSLPERIAVANEDRHLIAYGGIVLDNPSPYLRNLSNSLDSLLPVTLSRLPGFFLLEREHLMHLKTEQDLTDIQKAMKQSAMLITLNIKKSIDGKSYEISIASRSNVAARPLVAQTKVPIDSKVGVIRDKICKKILGLLEVGQDSYTVPSASEEAKEFLGLGQLQQALGHPDRALKAYEAAYALLPSVENGLVFANALKAEGSVKAHLRAIEVFDECNRKHVADLKAGKTKSILMPEHIGYLGGLTKTQDTEGDRIAAQIHDMELEILRYRLEHYAGLSGKRNGNAAEYYWNEWGSLLGIFWKHYCPDDPARQLAVLDEFIKCYSNPPVGNKKRPLRSGKALSPFLCIVQTGAKGKAGKEVKSYIEKLKHHPNPDVRLSAHLGNSDKDHVPEKLLWHVLADNLDIRDDGARTLLDHIIKTGALNPKMAESPKCVEEKKNFLRQIVDSKSLSFANLKLKLLGDNTSGILEGIFNSGQEKEALQLAEDIMLKQRDALMSHWESRKKYYVIKKVKKPIGLPEGAAYSFLSKHAPKHLEKIRRSIEKKVEPELKPPTPEVLNWDNYTITHLPYDLDQKNNFFVEGDELLSFSCIVTGGVAELSLGKYDLSNKNKPVHKKNTILYEGNSSKRHGANGRIEALCRIGNKLFGTGLAGELVAVNLESLTINPIDRKHGFPYKSIRRQRNGTWAMAAMGDWLYLSVGDFVAYNPATQKLKVIASRSSVEKRNSLDGTPFEICAIVSDKERNIVWIKIGGDWYFQFGDLYTYDPEKGNIKLVASRVREKYGDRRFKYITKLGADRIDEYKTALCSDAIRKIQTLFSMATYGRAKFPVATDGTRLPVKNGERYPTKINTKHGTLTIFPNGGTFMIKSNNVP